MKIGEVVRDGDFKAEKHVPTIEAPEKVKAGEEALVKVCVGKEIKHPNTPLHHISWIQLYFKPAEGPVVDVAKFCYNSHGDTMNLKPAKSGELIAVSYCNVHGLWESSKAIEVE